MTQITRLDTIQPRTMGEPCNKKKKKIFIGRIAHSKTLQKIEIFTRASLGVDSDGHVSFLDSSATCAQLVREKYAHLGFSDAECKILNPLQFLFPGLVDTHLHACQWPNIAIGMEGDLREWVEDYTDPMEASYADNDKARRVYTQVVRKTLAVGTTSVAYNTTIHYQAANILADLCLKFGQRAVIGKSCCVINSTHGNREESVAKSLEDEIKTIRHIERIDPEGELLSPCIQPRGGPFCPPALMAGLGQITPKGSSPGGPAKQYHVQAHMCEDPGDIKRTLEVHSSFQNYTDMYSAYGLLHSKSILAHCIHLSEQDMGLLVSTKAGIAHCPNSNTCLTDGECRVRQLLKLGIKIGLGTDVSAGYSFSILNAMRSASDVSRHLVIHTGNPEWKLGFEEIVYLGTMGGAEVLAMEEKIGNFEEGKCFDALLVDVGRDDDLIDVDGWEGDDLALVKKWVFMGDDRSIRQVYVNGALVADKG